MNSLEQLLIRLDSGAWSAAWRMTLGLCIPPVFRALLGGRDSILASMVLFIGLLAFLRLVPALLRGIVPFSIEAKKVWKERRFIAKRHDSYQWQKLFWIGLGLILYAIIGDRLKNGELAVAVVCLVGGCLGLLFWSSVRDRAPSVTIARLC